MHPMRSNPSGLAGIMAGAALLAVCMTAGPAMAGFPDCNGNGVPDDQDIANGTSEDCNENGIPDECECLEDADGNGIPDECEPGFCGCMDVVLVVDDTSSMGPAIDNVKLGLEDIIDAAVFASGGDLRMGLVTFKDDVEADQPLTFTISDVENAVMALAVSGGAGLPEASDEALNYVVNGATNCTLSEPEGPLGSFRNDCLKITVMVTDALPGGCDDIYTAGVDDVNADMVAQDAAAANILLSAIYNETNPPDTPLIVPIMLNYANVTGGVFIQTPADGSGTGQGIEDIIEACGGDITDCNNNGIDDACDILQGRSQDCQPNGVPDECDLANGTSMDCNNNDIPDECEEDCNNNGIPDDCDIDNGTSQDCNNNGIPDECDIDDGTSQDCQPDGIPDECQLGNCLNQYPGASFGSPFSDLDCDACGGLQVLAENFSISAPTSVNAVRFWGGYFPNDAASIHDAFTVVIRDDNAGAPGNALITYGPVFPDLKLDSGITASGLRIFEYTIELPGPVALNSAGTWWVEIYNDTSVDGHPDDDWFWYEGLNDPLHTVANSAFSSVIPEVWNIEGRQLSLRVFCDEPDNDCNMNGIPDECEEDCNNNGIPDDCDTKPDCDPTIAVEMDVCEDAMCIGPDILYHGDNFGTVFDQGLFCGKLAGVYDVWYKYSPAYTGTVFIRVEGPPVKWIYAVYEGCPAGPFNYVDCNDTQHFEIVFTAEKGKTYYLQIAGYLFSRGNFEMNMVGPPHASNPGDCNLNGIPDECECLADVNGDGIVNALDLSLVLQALGMSCIGCPEDVDGSGQVTPEDYVIVLNNLGPCPFTPVMHPGGRVRSPEGPGGTGGASD